MSDQSIIDLSQRYMDTRVQSNGSGTEFEWAELAEIRDYVFSQFKGDRRIILAAFTGTEREFSKGHRCSVCGRTELQNEAIGYDCSTQC